MATVRITHAIRDHVRRKIKKMFEDRIKAAHNALQALPIADAAYEDTFPSEALDLVRQLMEAHPDAQWFGEYSDAYVEIPLDPQHPSPDGRGLFVARIKYRKPRPIPAGRAWSTNYKLKRTNPIYPTAVAAVMEIKHLENERKKLEATLVDGVLTQCTTLRQVLELWPTALEFMPDEAKQRHAEPTAKRGASAKAAEVSVEVKAALMTARMLSTQ